jgi:chemotaxis protein methyltransferase CheR
MTDRDCILFLQWALPRMRLRWPGFRPVRRQVCRRVGERINGLGLAGAAAYRDYLEQQSGEWEFLDRCCRITISRFFRDQGVFRALEQSVLPDLARAVRSRGGQALACWSAGCASGEEPMSLAILWRLRLQERFPGLRLNILATDADENMLERAAFGRYRASSLKDLPAIFRAEAFDAIAGEFMLRESFRDYVRFLQHDLRKGPPDGPFDLVLCRNSAFTYFEESLQEEVLAAITDAMVPGGALVVGIHESLPPAAQGFEGWGKGSNIFRKSPDQKP